ncbi:MAG: DUF5063 domain-containing protein [Muribaculaceae bacterium]|nr:DUF5063 domain-containing protein [Muribaculaceae bacterium]
MENDIKTRLLDITALATGYCGLMEQAADYSQKSFVIETLGILPRLYLDFSDPALDLGENDEYFSTYIDEDYYESIRRRLEMLMGEHDVFLETFEEDMKYSDTPVAASVSESLADIYQALYNFVSIVRETEGDSLEGAYIECRENFASYWSQTLCNVLRALNHLRYNVELADYEE